MPRLEKFERSIARAGDDHLYYLGILSREKFEIPASQHYLKRGDRYPLRTMPRLEIERSIARAGDYHLYYLGILLREKFEIPTSQHVLKCNYLEL